MEQAQTNHDPRDVTFIQNIKGLEQELQRFQRTKALHATLHRVLHAGEGNPPIITIPTGGRSEDGRPLHVDVDVSRLLRGTSREQARDLLWQIFGPIMGWCHQEYSQCLDKVQRYAGGAYRQLQEGSSNRLDDMRPDDNQPTTEAVAHSPESSQAILEQLQQSVEQNSGGGAPHG